MKEGERKYKDRGNGGREKMNDGERENEGRE